MHVTPRAHIYVWSARACLCLLIVALSSCAEKTYTVINKDPFKSIPVPADDLATDYQKTMHEAHGYMAKCKESPPVSIACDSRLVAQITVASDRAWSSIEAAQTARLNHAPTASSALAHAKAKLAYLHEFTNKIPKTERRPKPAL